MAADIIKLLLLTSALFLQTLFAATTSKPPTPINTCCPPGHFLAIEDLQESRQDPEGVWSPPEDYTIYHLKAGDEGPMVEAIYIKSEFANKWWDLTHHRYNSGNRVFREKSLTKSNNKGKIDRHQHISRVSCVPDKNDLPSIDGLSGSSLPTPPYFATKEDWRQGISVEMRVLAEDQMLQSTGSRLPSCPGGSAELATIVLGEGQSSGNTWKRPSRPYTSPHLRINQAGRLAGRNLNVISLSNLRIGKVEVAGPMSEEPTLGNETELNVDFCLTWNTDPRTKLRPRQPVTTTTTTTSTERCCYENWERERDDRRELEEAFLDARPHLPLLQAVYCDPCKTKVVCSLVTGAPWYFLQKYIDPVLLHGEGGKPTIDHQIHPVLVSYLDADKDGKVSIHEFYDVKIVNLLRRIFDGLDANNDGTVDLSEATFTSLLRPAFFRSVTEELFDFADVDNDNMLSMEDIPPLELSRVDNVCFKPGKPLSECLTKLNKTVELCHIFGNGEEWSGQYWHTTESLMCNSLMSIYLPLVDRNGDDTLTLEEVQQPFLRLFQFLVGKPGQRLGIGELVSGFDKLREPPIISNSLRQLLTPVLDTFPRMFLQSLVTTADKNNDNMMDFSEFEGFNDFMFVPRKWYEIGATALRALRSFTVCDQRESCLPCGESNPRMLLRYFSNSDVILRLVHNLFYHKDFQFPAWELEE